MAHKEHHDLLGAQLHSNTPQRLLGNCYIRQSWLLLVGNGYSYDIPELAKIASKAGLTESRTLAPC